MQEVIKQIEYGDLLLGMLHGFGLAMDVHPAPGTLYINARSIIEGNCLRELAKRSDGGMPRQREQSLESQRVLGYLMENRSAPSVTKNIVGAMAWIGVLQVLPEDLTNPDHLYGMLVAQVVIERQRDIENLIDSGSEWCQGFKDQILLDQTNLANIVLGNPPDDAACCWLVTKWLADKLHDHTQEIVHQLGTTYWWQQEDPFTETTNLTENPALQRIANSMIPSRW